MTKEEWIKIYNAKDGTWDKDDLIDKAYEIIEALKEHYINKGDRVLIKNTIDLINRQKTKTELYEKVNALIAAQRDERDEHIVELEAEIERLRKETSQTIESIRKLAKDTIRDTKSEAIKEFAERLKKKAELLETLDDFDPCILWAIKISVVDNLVKEMTEHRKEDEGK